MKWTVQHDSRTSSYSIVGEPDENGYRVEIVIPDQNESDAMHIASALATAGAIGRMLVTSLQESTERYKRHNDRVEAGMRERGSVPPQYSLQPSIRSRS